jgi:hypothetical protein
MLLPLPAVALSGEQAWRFVHGTEQATPPGTPDGKVKVVTTDERLLGIGWSAEGLLRPAKVLPVEAAG